MGGQGYVALYISTRPLRKVIQGIQQANVYETFSLDKWRRSALDLFASETLQYRILRDHRNVASASHRTISNHTTHEL